MRPIALIPARGGSKRLPRKNVKSFAGRPMLAWTLDAASESGLFSRVAVSTEDQEIARVADDAGAAVHWRSPELATDGSTLVEVLKEFSSSLPSQVPAIALLLANCPLRTADDIISGHRTLTDSGAPAVLSYSTFLWTPPFRALSVQDGELRGFFGDWVEKKSQAYPEVVCPSGAVYWIRREFVDTAKDLYLPGLRGFDMPWHRAIDIDTADDFRVAESIRFAMDHGYRFEC